MACVLPGLGEDDGAGDTGSASASASTTASTTGSATDAASSGESGSDSVADSGESGSAESTGGTTGGDPLATCSDASLYMGNPFFDGELQGWNPNGQGLRADPPLRSRHLANFGGQLAIDTQYEVWGVDGDQVRRIAGNENEGETQYQPSGACEDVRIIIGAGVAGTPDGRVFVADRRGNGVIELSDPLGNCTAQPIAGNPEVTIDLDITEDVAAKGDVDGPGLEARFYSVERPTADADGNVFVFDTGNRKLKRIADDAEHTVTTLLDYGEAAPFASTAMGGKVYMTGTTSSGDFLWAVDAETGEVDELFEGRGIFAEIDSHTQATLFAIESDGVDLFIGSGQGYIFRVSTEGQPLGVVAGYGTAIDFPDIDLEAPIPLDQLPIRSYATAEAGLVRVGDDLMFTNVNAGIGFHVWSIHCGG